MRKFISDISQKELPLSERVSANALRPSIIELIQKDCPKFSTDSVLSREELKIYREKYLEELLLKPKKELTELEKLVLEKTSNNEIISEDTDEDPLSFAQRIADKVAEFGGSWNFIIGFLSFMAVWIIINIYLLVERPFDPYPFILLNLILSCLAALQAPVIMMSQNRQEEKDRRRSKNDYMINLKSELEIRVLHEKVDHIVMHQHEEMVEIQRVQIEMMNDLLTLTHQLKKNRKEDIV